MADAVPPPSGGGHTTTPVLVRNIIVGALTTILGSTTVYFITHANDKAAQATSSLSPAEKLLVTKEVTGKAWKSYVAIDNVYYKNIKVLQTSFLENKNIGAYKEDMLKEAASFRKDVENILKEENLDESFSSLLNRRLDREKESMAKTSDYLDEVDRLMKSNLSMSEKQDRAREADKKYFDYAKSVLLRASNELEDLAKNLSDKYMQPFNVNDFNFYSEYKKNFGSGNTGNPNPGNNGNGQTGNTNGDNQGPQQGNNGEQLQQSGGTNPANNTIRNTASNYTARDFTGTWEVSGAFIKLSSNGKMNWEMDNGDYAYGTWTYNNNKIEMKATSNHGQKADWIFDLDHITPNSFVMRLQVQPYNTYYMVRSQD